MPQELNLLNREHYAKFNSAILNEYVRVLSKTILKPLEDSTPEQQEEFRVYLETQITVIKEELEWRKHLSDSEPTETIELD